MVSTALSMLENGVVRESLCGGRRDGQMRRDAEIRKAVLTHIEKFPRVESHYCRKDSQKQYLHPDLNACTMHRMYLAEGNPKVSLSFYQKLIYGLNLSFHKPKKGEFIVIVLTHFSLKFLHNETQ